MRGGYACIGHLPQPAKTDTCIVLVEASPSVLLSMYNDPKFLFLASLLDGTPTIATIQYLKNWFSAHPFYEEKVLSSNINSVLELLKKICIWHGVDKKELERELALNLQVEA